MNVEKPFDTYLLREINNKLSTQEQQIEYLTSLIEQIGEHLNIEFKEETEEGEE